jgi:hypothetical protein
MNLKRRIVRLLATTDNPAKRRALFVAALSKEMESRGAGRPIVVGGEALELYTQGSYTTGDIDLKARRDTLISVLTGLGFVRVSRVWVQKEWDIWVDWAGAALDEGKEAERRAVEVMVSRKPELTVRVLSLEDLIVDRLAAAKYWNDMESARWAKVLIEMGRGGGIFFDTEYFESRLRSRNLEDIFRRITKRPAKKRKSKKQAAS